MYILIVVFFIFLLFLILVSSLLSTVSRILSLFRFRSKKSRRENERTASWSSSGDAYSKNHGNNKKKIFGNDEGEYVDFEEIKENDLN